MNTTRKNKMFSSSIVLSLLTLISVFFVGIGNVFADSPQFNYMSNDIKTLRLGNYTTSVGTFNWAGTISADAGQRIAVDVYYHNGVTGTTATNTRMRINYPNTAGTQMNLSSTLWADNASQVIDTATLNISSSQTITFENQARWLPNQQTTSTTMIPVTYTGNSVEVNIGNVAGGWPSQGHVIFYLNITNNTQSQNPVVSAGSDLTVGEGQSIPLSATATDPQGDSMTYSWTCNGGSVSNPTLLSTNYNAPSVTADTTYICTFTARDTNGNTGSDSLNITVVNSVPPSPSAPIVDAGNNISVNEGQSAALSATATDPNSLAMTYSWTCNGGSLTSSTILNPIYNAPSVTANTSYACTFTARNTNGYSTSDAVYINVVNTDTPNPLGGNTSSGWGGPDLNVTLSANPATGQSPLNGVDLTATVTSTGLSDYPITYRFDCENNNSWELMVQANNTSYTASKLCNYYYDDVYTAKVKVERGGYTAYAQATITPGKLTGNGYGISVDAGPSKDIGENQSTILNGYAYDQYGYGLTYHWTCNGGSLSNSNSLTPTYYAPVVNADVTYTCTLLVTDTRGYKNSDTANIIVRNTGIGTSSGLSVSTNVASNVSINSATLNGAVNNDGGQYVSVRFNWGKLSSYNNFTPWISNKATGDIFNYYVAGLEKGKTYHYRVEASNGKEVVVGQDVAFMTKPDSPTGLTANSAGSGQISLSWNKGDAACYTMITRKAGSYSANSADGTVVYYGTGNAVVDKNLSNNVWYYYRAWSVGCDEGLVSYSESQNARAYATATTGYVAPIVETIEKGISVEALARDTTQNEIGWENSITATPNDEIEFKVIITPTGAKSLEDVILKAVLSDKISSVKDIKVNDESYSGSLSDDMKLGIVALGESKIITFKGKIDSKDKFSYGSNELASAFEVSASNNGTTKKDIKIDVNRSVESEAGLASLINMNAYAGLLTFLFIILTIVTMYLLIERKKIKEGVVEKSGTKVEKSKYFNIK